MLFSQRDKQDALAVARTEPVRGEQDVEAGFFETAGAAFDLVRSEELSTSELRWWRRENETRLEQIEQVVPDMPEHVRSVYLDMSPEFIGQINREFESGKIEVTEDGDVISQPSRTLPARAGGRGEQRRRDARRQRSGRGAGQETQEQQTGAPAYPESAIRAVAWMRQVAEAIPQVPNDDEMWDVISRKAATERTENQAIMARGGGLARFTGEAAGLMTDPIVLGTLPFGGAQRQAGKTLIQNVGRMMGAEAGIAAATEIPIQSQVFQFKDRIESPWGFKEAAFNTVSATIGAGVLAGVIGTPLEMVARNVDRRTAMEAATQYERLKEEGRIQTTDESDQAAEDLRRYAEIAEGNPFADADERAHFDVMQQAYYNFQEGLPIDVSEAVRGLDSPHDIRNHVPGGRQANDSEAIEQVNAAELRVDADLFQSRSFTDGAGLDETLDEATAFDPARAGTALVWEDTAGNRFVVDGHQRAGLARRSEGDTTMDAFILREADGVAPEDARAVAVWKNAALGRGSATDLARVMRETGMQDNAILPPLTNDTRMARMAGELANLSDEALSRVAGEAIPENMGAMVGRVVEDADEQTAIIDFLRRASPENENQAEAMALELRGSRSDAIREATENLPDAPEIEVSRGTGEVVYRFKGGEITADETANAIQVRLSGVPEYRQGRGIGTAMYERGIRDAIADGKDFVSDRTLSPAGQAMWRRLERLGYPVEQNPNALRSETGALFLPSDVADEGVFRISRDAQLPQTSIGVGTPTTITQARAIVIDETVQMARAGEAFERFDSAPEGKISRLEAEDHAQTIEVVSALAETRKPVADALDEAAESILRGGDRAEAAQAFGRTVFSERLGRDVVGPGTGSARFGESGNWRIASRPIDLTQVEPAPVRPGDPLKQARDDWEDPAETEQLYREAQDIVRTKGDQIELPDGEVVNEDGDRLVTARTARETFAEMDQQELLLRELSDCRIGD